MRLPKKAQPRSTRKAEYHTAISSPHAAGCVVSTRRLNHAQAARAPVCVATEPVSAFATTLLIFSERAASTNLGAARGSQQAACVQACVSGIQVGKSVGTRIASVWRMSSARVCLTGQHESEGCGSEERSCRNEIAARSSWKVQAKTREHDDELRFPVRQYINTHMTMMRQARGTTLLLPQSPQKQRITCWKVLPHVQDRSVRRKRVTTTKLMSYLHPACAATNRSARHFEAHIAHHTMSIDTLRITRPGCVAQGSLGSLW